MAVLSELLLFPHHTCARGSTVERAFLEDLALALGFDASGLRTKDDVLLACIERVGGSAGSGWLSEGETVTNAALQEIIDGVVRSGLQKISLTVGAAAARVALAGAESGDDSLFDPLLLSDERKVSLRAVKVRSGQSSFRDSVLRAYGGRCAISGCDVLEALEAAHIRPYSGPRANTIRNGVCLRADLHRLWDTGRLAVHESTLEVLLDGAMIGTDYSFYAGDVMRLPHEARHHPSSVALQQQREWAGL